VTTKHRITAGIAALALGLGGALLVASPAAAVGCDVSSNGNGDVDGTLVHALTLANAGSCPTGITFSIAGTVPGVAEALPPITGDVELIGPGEANLTIIGLGNVFQVNAGGSLTISDLTIDGATTGISADGAGVAVSLTGVTVDGATGDGIYVKNGNLTGSDIKAMNNGGNGIEFEGQDSADTLELYGSDAGLNSANGVQFTTLGSNTIIDDLFVELNSSFGLDAGVDGGRFDGTDIVAASTVNFDGIHIAAGNDAQVELTGGHAVENGENGYTLEATNATIQADDVAAFDNGSNGVDVEAFGPDAFVVVSNSQSYQNAGDGFFILAEESSEVELTSSRSYENGDESAGESGAGVSVTVRNSDVTIEDTEIDHNDNFNGGGIFAIVTDGELDVRTSHIHHNLAYFDDSLPFTGHGGGMYLEIEGEDAEVSVTDSDIEQNEAARAGGGVKIQTFGILPEEVGSLEFLRTSIRDNEVLDSEDGYGGGIALVDFYAHEDGSPVMVIDSSTISGNTARYQGGLYAFKSTSTQATGTIQVVNSTVSGNTGRLGAGILLGTGENGTPAFLLLEHSTVADNTDPVDDLGGVLISDANLDMSHTILSDNETDLTLTGNSLLFAEWNIVENPDTTTGLDDPADHNRTGIDPKLGPLALNGGTTETHLLLEGSPAIDTGDPDIFNPPLFDQRGDARVVRIIDIGAVEMPIPPLPATGGEVSPAIPLGALLLLLAGAGLVVTRRRAA
jgi:LPXTG-motif cell wall-anchored protein